MKKRTFFVALAAMMLTLNANAQSNESDGKGRPDPSEMIQKRTDEMVSTYGLDSDQAAKLLELNKKYAEKMKPQGRGPRPERNDSAFAGGNRPTPPQQGCQGNCCQGGGGLQGGPQGPGNNKMEEYNKELKAIIGDENYSKYEEAMKNRQPRGPKPSQEPQQSQE